MSKRPSTNITPTRDAPRHGRQRLPSGGLSIYGLYSNEYGSLTFINQIYLEIGRFFYNFAMSFGGGLAEVGRAEEPRGATET